MALKRSKQLPVQDRRTEFAYAYLENGHDAKEAYKSVYPDASDLTAKVRGLEVLRSPEVQGVLSMMRQRAMVRADISEGRVAEELGRIAFADIRRCFDEDGNLLPIHQIPEDVARAITSIEHDTNKLTGERTPRYKLGDKMSALSLLANVLGMVKQKHEVGGVLTLASLTSDLIDTPAKVVDAPKSIPAPVEEDIFA